MLKKEEEDRTLEIAEAISASLAFEGLMWGDVGASKKIVKEKYSHLAEWLRNNNRPPIWTNNPWSVARCVILGIHPITGEGLEDSDSFILQFEDQDNPDLGDNARKIYSVLQTYPLFQK